MDDFIVYVILAVLLGAGTLVKKLVEAARARRDGGATDAETVIVDELRRPPPPRSVRPTPASRRVPGAETEAPASDAPGAEAPAPERHLGEAGERHLPHLQPQIAGAAAVEADEEAPGSALTEALDRLELNPIQRAIATAEILGPPRTAKRGRTRV